MTELLRPMVRSLDEETLLGIRDRALIKHTGQAIGLALGPFARSLPTRWMGHRRRRD